MSSSRRGDGDDSSPIIRVGPYQYLHVLNSNTNVVRVVTGPTTFARPEHEKIIEGPSKMIIIPPRHYAVIAEPALRDAHGKPVEDEFGLVKLRHGDTEIRDNASFPNPFPLYPGEQVVGNITKFRVVETNQALRLRVVRDYEEKQGDELIQRHAGDDFLFLGPGTYHPRVEVEEKEIINATIVTHSKALHLRARQGTVDRNGVARKAGEEWLWREEGAYLPSVDEELVRQVGAVTLTERRALRLRAKKNFTDVYGKSRRSGDDWLITLEESSTHIPDVHEEVVGHVDLTTLTSRQFCIVLNPIDTATGVQRLGARELRRGECSFFLRPGEELESGELQEVYVLAEDQALLLQAVEEFMDEEQKRQPGDRWLVRGPREFVPNIHTDVVETRTSIPLDANEGIYVRNTATGQVRAVVGESYMLTAKEELWEKELPAEVEELLVKQSFGQTYVPPAHHRGNSDTDWAAAPNGKEDANKKQNRPPTVRDRTRVVQLRVPNNAAVQVFDFRAKTSRVVLGPDSVLLAPDEQFTMIMLSGDTPKRPNVIRTLSLMLGSDFMTDSFEVETSDHARLRLKVAYSWVFDIDRTDQAQLAKCFSVRDFVGDCSKAMASRIRGAVAMESFDRFHKCSAKIIRASIFGMDEGKVRDIFRFPANGLTITNVDIQSVEPVDASTRESLQRSVQLAIEITTRAQESKATHDASREEALAEGLLERQKLTNEAEAEAARKRLLELRAESKAVETSGVATAEARAKAEAAKIENEGLVSLAKTRAEALQIQRETELQMQKAEQQQQLAHLKAMSELDIAKSRELAKIETEKFAQIVQAIGANTIAEIARAGPEMQAKLLNGLGLKSVMLTDGKSPINLFNSANGLLGGGNGM